MKRIKPVITRNAAELVAALNLPPEDAVEMQIRRQLTEKITEVVTRRGLTHDEAAKTAKTSRTRLTAILNGNSRGVSTDLLLRILAALGYSARISFRRCRAA